MAINYLAELKGQFAEHFTLVKNNTPDKALILRLQGYIYAGEILGILTKEDAQAIMEEQHKLVFGQSIESRKAAKQQIKNALQEGNNDYFDIPAIERKKC